MIKNFILLIFFSFSFFSNKSDLKQVKYNFSTEPIDVIIPCTIKDKICLEKCINCIKEHGKNIRRIVVVSKTKLTNKAEWFDEEKFPFNFKEIAYELFKDEKKATNYLKSKKNRLGWLFQQLIKFYAIYTIPNISSNVLMLDADVIYLNHTSFINKKTNAAYLNRAKEHHPSYFEHGKRLIPGFYKVKKRYSGICHNMVFQKPVLDHLFKIVKKKHKKEFWRAFINSIDIKDLFIGASEYEIYFNFAQITSKQFKVRKLKWKNTKNVQNISKYKKKNYNYIAWHHYDR